MHLFFGGMSRMGAIETQLSSRKGSAATQAAVNGKSRDRAPNQVASLCVVAERYNNTGASGTTAYRRKCSCKSPCPRTVCRNVAVPVHSELSSPVDPFTRGYDLSLSLRRTSWLLSPPCVPSAACAPSSYQREGGPGTETPRLRKRFH